MSRKILVSIDEAPFTNQDEEVQKVDVHLATADILTLFSVPIVAIPAPGVGKMAVLHKVLVEWVPEIATYQGGLRIVYAGLLDQELTQGIHSLDSEHRVQILVGENTVESTAYAENQPIWAQGQDSDLIPLGLIVEHELGAGGSGYAPGDTGGLGEQLYEVDTVDGGGGVLTYHFTGGSTVALLGLANTYVLTGGGDAGFTINVTEISEPDGDCYLTLYYTIADLH